jgi:hypothetical protein
VLQHQVFPAPVRRHQSVHRCAMSAGSDTVIISDSESHADVETLSSISDSEDDDTVSICGHDHEDSGTDALSPDTQIATKCTDEWMILHHLERVMHHEHVQLIAEFLSDGMYEQPGFGWVVWDGISAYVKVLQPETEMC